MKRFSSSSGSNAKSFINIALVGPSNVALIYYLLPLFSGIEAFLILDEPATAVHVLSGGLIIGGVAWATRVPKAHPARTSPG